MDYDYAEDKAEYLQSLDLIIRQLQLARRSIEADYWPLAADAFETIPDDLLPTLREGARLRAGPKHP